jgi:hypothetical protein
MRQVVDFIGFRSRIRTCDPLIKSQLLDEGACRKGLAGPSRTEGGARRRLRGPEESLSKRIMALHSRRRIFCEFCPMSAQRRIANGPWAKTPLTFIFVD